MKNITNVFQVKMALIVAILMTQLTAFAQIDVDIDLGGKQEWYENPYVWVGVGVFLLVLVLLLRKK